MDEIVADPTIDTQNVIHYAFNSAQPLLRLPAEILGLIFQGFLRPFELGRKDFKPHWHCSVSDCSALIPISQTCRRLREVVRSLPAVAKNIVMFDNKEHETREIGKEMPLNVFVSLYSNIPPTLSEFYVNESHRIQELHLISLSHKALDLWRSLLLLPAPKLRFLSLTSPRGIAWLPQKGAFIPFPPKALDLRYLTLNSVCFLPENRLPSLTHLALLDIYVPRLHTSLAKVLARCPNLESLVLSNIQESIESNLSDPPTLRLTRLQRITVRQMGSDHLPFYLACLPRTPNQVYQLLDPGSDLSLVTQSLLPRYSPLAHTLSFSYHVQPTEDDKENIVYSPKTTAMSITAVGPDGALQIVRGISQPYSCVKDTVFDILHDKAALTGVREAWFVGFHPTKAIPDKDSDDHNFLIFRSMDRDGHHISSIVRGAFSLLPSLDTLVHVFRRTLEPNLWILPSTESPGFASRQLKTVKLVVCHGLPPHDSNSLRTVDTLSSRPTLSLAKVREGLATRHHAYLDTLIIQVAAHVVVDEVQLLEVSQYVPTVKVERLSAVPELALPVFCREPAASSTWLGALW